MGFLDQTLELGLRHDQFLLGTDLFDYRELCSGQAGQHKPAAPATNFDLVAIDRDGDRGLVGQRPDDLQELTAWNSDFTGLDHVGITTGDQLDFQISASHRQTTCRTGCDQHIGQDGHGLFAFDHADDALQWLEDLFTGSGKFHAGGAPSGFLKKFYLNLLQLIQGLWMMRINQNTVSIHAVAGVGSVCKQ